MACGRPTMIEDYCLVWENGWRVDDGLEQIGGSMDGVKVTDDGEVVEVVATGKLMDDEGRVWIAGEGFEYRTVKENGKHILYTPPISASHTKKDAENLTLGQLMKKMTKELRSKMRPNMVKLGFTYPNEEDDDRDLKDVDWGIFSPDYRGPPVVPEYDSDSDSPTCEGMTSTTDEGLSMEKLNSVLDGCAVGVCDDCKGKGMD